MVENEHTLNKLRESFSSALKPFILVNKLFGSFPSYINILGPNSKSVKSEKLKTKLLTIIQGAFIIFMVKICIENMYNVLKVYQHDFALMTNIFRRATFLFFYLNTIMVYFLCHHNKNQYIEITEKLFKTHVTLCNICGFFDFKKVKKLLNGYLKLLFLCLLLFYVNDFYVFQYMAISSTEKLEIKAAILDFILYSGNILYLSQFLAFIYLIKYEFWIINRKLDDLVNIKVKHIKTSNFEEILAILRREHLAMTILLEEINEIFGIYIIGKLATAFGGLTIHFFQIYRLLEKPALNLENRLKVLIVITRCFYRICELFLPLFVSEMVLKERIKTLKILQQLLLKEEFKIMVCIF